MGMSVPTLNVAFLPSNARTLGEERIFTIESSWRNFEKSPEGIWTTQSEALRDERKIARRFVSPPETSPATPVGCRSTPA